jgi:hypothetical protein
LVFLFLPFFVRAQNDTALLRSVKLSYENDLFTHTDYYYTGGSFLDFNLPGLRKFPTAKILLKLPHGKDESFGIYAANLGYTPRSIKSDSILFGDRPFAATLYLGLNRISCNSEKQWQLKSNLDLGVIGPLAFGYESQKFIHAHTNNPEPHGWQFQVNNDVYVNYGLVVKKGLLKKKHFCDFIADAFVNAGTVFDNAGIGVTAMAGKFDPYFAKPSPRKYFQCYIFGRGEMKIIARDATLQGGLFNTSSAYLVAADDLERTVFLFEAGIKAAYKKIGFEFSNTAITPEFKNGWPHAWGHLGIEYYF